MRGPVEMELSRQFQPRIVRDLSGVQQQAADEVLDLVDELVLPREFAAPKPEILLLEQEFEPAEMPRPAVAEPEEPFLLVSVDQHLGASRQTVSPLQRQLSAARKLADAARVGEDRSRAALYRAIGCAYDFSLAAMTDPEGFAQLLGNAGLTMQDRAPMTPVVKLVFGPDYDKTRLTEYAAALAHAHRLGVSCGAFDQYLLAAPGGLKAVVREERALRRPEAANSARLASTGPAPALARKLRGLPTADFSSLAADGDEFVLILARRDPAHGVSMIGEVADATLLEKAARKVIAKAD